MLRGHPAKLVTVHFTHVLAVLPRAFSDLVVFRRGKRKGVLDGTVTISICRFVGRRLPLGGGGFRRALVSWLMLCLDVFYLRVFTKHFL